MGLVNRPNGISLLRANQSQAKFKSAVVWEFAAKLGEFDYSSHECDGECEELSICALFASANNATLKFGMMLDAMNMSVNNI